ncbi:hypothetical protein C8R43DRAFT_1133604 [Mycena crocata]|nr:hypothetical protein C8R43DRAFT_1133604 [Mycena crocata]
MSVFNRLPSELKVPILYLSCDTDRDHWCFFADFRAIVCLVCKDWRKIVYSSPNFWLLLPVTRNTRVEFLRFALERSRPKGIDVFLHCGRIGNLPKRNGDWWLKSVNPGTMDRFRSEVLPGLFPDVSRVYSLTVKCWMLSDWTPLHAALGTLPGGTIEKMSLSLSGWYSGSVDAPPWYSATLPFESSITELQMFGVSTTWGSQAVIARLTVFRLGGRRNPLRIKWSTIATLLRAAHALSVLEINKDETLGDVVLGPSIHMLNLTRLEVAYRRPETVDAIARMQLPALRELFISTSIPASVDYLLSGWTEHLRRVVEVGIDIPGSLVWEVKKMLEHIPLLHTLRVHPAATTCGHDVLELMSGGSVRSVLRHIHVGSVSRDRDLAMISLMGSPGVHPCCTVSFPTRRFEEPLDRMTFDNAMASLRTEWRVGVGSAVLRQYTLSPQSYDWLQRIRPMTGTVTSASAT